MNLHRYPGGYAEYVAAQVAANRRKLGKVWATEATVAHLAQFLGDRLAPPPQRGLCHGTRGGPEQAWFRRCLPGAEVWGTEIAPTAAAFPWTMQWDFHELRPEWRGAWDFVYSNSLDHAYDPARALGAWVDALRVGGLCLVEHSPAHDAASPSDPFGATPDELYDLVGQWGAGRYGVLDVLRVPAARARGVVLVVGRMP